MKPAPLQIYKLLPRTNCRDCGFDSCLALATYLFAYGPESITKCPHISSEVVDQVRALFGAAGNDSPSSMINLWQEFRKKLAILDFEILAKLEGFSGSGASVSFLMLDDRVTVTSEDILSERGVLAEHDRILVYYYITTAADLDSDYEFCDYRSFYSKLKVRDAQQESFEVKIQEFFGDDLDALKRSVTGLGGMEVELFRDVYDMSLMTFIFPMVPVLLLYSKGEEELPAYCKFMFDKGCSVSFDTEGIERLSDLVVERIIEKAREQAVSQT